MAIKYMIPQKTNYLDNTYSPIVLFVDTFDDLFDSSVTIQYPTYAIKDLPTYDDLGNYGIAYRYMSDARYGFCLTVRINSSNSLELGIGTAYSKSDYTKIVNDIVWTVTYGSFDNFNRVISHSIESNHKYASFVYIKDENRIGVAFSTDSGQIVSRVKASSTLSGYDFYQLFEPYRENAPYMIQGKTLYGIADAIRERNGETDDIPVTEMRSKILSIPTVSQKFTGTYELKGGLICDGNFPVVCKMGQGTYDRIVPSTKPDFRYAWEIKLVYKPNVAEYSGDITLCGASVNQKFPSIQIHPTQSPHRLWVGYSTNGSSWDYAQSFYDMELSDLTKDQKYTVIVKWATNGQLYVKFSNEEKVLVDTTVDLTSTPFYENGYNAELGGNITSSTYFRGWLYLNECYFKQNDTVIWGQE